MKDVCRDPWGLKRIVRRHQDQAGLVLYGRFNRLRGWLPHGDWDAVLVRVDGRDREVLDQVKRGPVWVPLDAAIMSWNFSVEGTRYMLNDCNFGRRKACSSRSSRRSGYRSWARHVTSGVSARFWGGRR